LTGLADALNAFYRGRRVLVTGHTGFKGAWLTLWLRRMGATVGGVSLPPSAPLGIFNAAELGSKDDAFIDVRDLPRLEQAFAAFKPDLVFHLAAQAIVGTGYSQPVDTFDVNVMGTVNVLECMRRLGTVAAGVMVTSDKCYENFEQIWGYREHDHLGGADPYSASKGAAEIVVSSYSRSFFGKEGTAHIASARAGNVVGGGDWSELRLIPDCVRSLRTKAAIELRNPQATRPWQFVLEPLAGYLLLGKRLVEGGKQVQGPWNFGPLVDNTSTVERGARAVIERWGEGDIQLLPTPPFKESMLLQLDSTKARRYLGWRPVLDFASTMQLTTDWYKHQHAIADASMRDYSLRQLGEYEQRLNADVVI
jgi:CDP-glucose 4,6-dehydratase